MSTEALTPWQEFIKPSEEGKYLTYTEDFLRARKLEDGSVEVQKPLVFHSSAGGPHTYAEVQELFASAPKGEDPMFVAFDVDTGMTHVDFYVWVKHRASAKQLAKAERVLAEVAK